MIGFAKFELKYMSSYRMDQLQTTISGLAMMTNPKMQNMFRTVSYLQLKVS